MRILFAIIVGLFVTSTVTAVEVTAEESYLLLNHAGPFCNNQRGLIKVIGGRINVWCAASSNINISIDNDNGTGLPQAVVGIDFHGDALEWIADNAKN